jgi:hypothetical protein
MKYIRLNSAFLALAVMATPTMADISDEANACIDELISRVGNVGGEVLGQEFSEAAIMVRLRDANGSVYECLVWSGPEIADFRQVSGEGAMADDGGGAMAGASGPPVVSGTERVQFAAGTSGAALSGTLSPNASVRYVLGAASGQFLRVDVSSREGALDYSILNPDGSFLLDPISSEKPYQGELWQSGDHVIEVINQSTGQASFDMGVGIE